MSNEAIKLELIEWLTNLEHDSTIQYLKIVKDSTSSNTDWADSLSDKSVSAINNGLEDIENNRIQSHDEIMKRFKLLARS